MRTRYRIKEDIARAYEVRSMGSHGRYGWANATIREWPAGGELNVQSDFGEYAYIWTSIGDRALREFLCGLSFDYFMGKARPHDYRQFDEAATRRGIKADIFGYLTDGNIDRATAHEWRDDVDLIEEGLGEQTFCHELYKHDWFHRLWDIGPNIVSRPTPQCRAFWDGPWRALTDHWKTELAAVAA